MKIIYIAKRRTKHDRLIRCHFARAFNLRETGGRKGHTTHR